MEEQRVEKAPTATVGGIYRAGAALSVNTACTRRSPRRARRIDSSEPCRVVVRASSGVPTAPLHEGVCFAPETRQTGSLAWPVRDSAAASTAKREEHPQPLSRLTSAPLSRDILFFYIL